MMLIKKESIHSDEGLDFYKNVKNNWILIFIGV